MKSRWWLGVAILPVLLVIGAFHGPTSGDIRLDSGDLRYRWFGIPIRYVRMSEPQRTQLLALSKLSPPVPAEWQQCVTYPLPSSNNTDLMCRGFYYDTAVWSTEDPLLARLALNDLVNYTRTMETRGGLPECTPLFSWSRRGIIGSGWKSDEEIQNYCAARGYMLVATTTTAESGKQFESK